MLRFLFIFVGISLVNRFEWILWAFGALLIFSGARMFKDDDDIIGTYCFEMEYGKDYKPSYLKDEGGNEIDFSTPEKLYDYLVGEM